MERYIVKGGAMLNGEVEIGGAKNAALAILAAAIMTDETVTIDNLPNVSDINVLLQAMKEIGARVERVDDHKVKINGSFINDVTVDNALIEAPKNFRRCNNLTLNNVTFVDAAETLWSCNNVKLNIIYH